MGADDRLAFARILLEKGAPLDARDDLLRSTPLGWACRWGHAELVSLLLAHGADPIEADAEPWATPRAWAEKMDRREVLAILGAHSATNGS
jgi:ankyrin repeat protein